MNLLKILLMLFMVGTIVSASSTILVLDASGSMDDTVSGSGGQKKIEIAKEAGNTFLNNVRSGDEVALIVFYDCNDIQTVVPFTTDTQSIRTAMAGVQPDSSTPIARAIDYAASYAVSSGRSGAGLIVLTDGEETCDSQAIAVTAAQNAISTGGVKIVNVVGFDIASGTSASNLQEIATAGGGTYYPASDANQLSSSLTQAYNANSGETCCVPAAIFFVLIPAALFFSRK